MDGLPWRGEIQSEQGILTGSFALLPIQQWFTDRVDNGELLNPHHWNQSFLIQVPELDENKLRDILQELVDYHDVLRIRYIKKGERWEQVYQGAISLAALKTIDVREYTEVKVQEILTDWQSGFDLQAGPLFQVGYLYGYNDGSARIYVAMHHMIVDGVSWRILLEDIKTLYEGKGLPQKTSSYRQWVECMEAYADLHPEEGLYWDAQVAGIGSSFIWDVKQGISCVGSLQLSEVLTKSLLQKASRLIIPRSMIYY